MKKYDQAKAEQMHQHIEACNKSGLTVSAYCVQNSIVKSNYYYWLKKLNGENKTSGFVALSVGKSSPQSGARLQILMNQVQASRLYR
ncbi:MAG: hypothetical protein BGP14_10050 [Sphingobacteriales bacterium 44-15]|uniref:IS66 family insertion sequence element accessory protein TnpA n=1 Tax=uncultured Dysgonomonas sp. TaxID=206096 RepID=UPI000964E2AC|nr:hypothetical protein [uncultured Dysgonomonas sp.]OJY90043.1 MAG: hypothetical protein BGP14_10050 [Sphingobacteriales bacterium 44-15]